MNSELSKVENIVIDDKAEAENGEGLNPANVAKPLDSEHDSRNLAVACVENSRSDSDEKKCEDLEKLKSDSEKEDQTENPTKESEGKGENLEKLEFNNQKGDQVENPPDVLENKGEDLEELKLDDQRDDKVENPGDIAENKGEDLEELNLDSQREDYQENPAIILENKGEDHEELKLDSQGEDQVETPGDIPEDQDKDLKELKLDSQRKEQTEKPAVILEDKSEVLEELKLDSQGEDQVENPADILENKGEDLEELELDSRKEDHEENPTDIQENKGETLEEIKLDCQKEGQFENSAKAYENNCENLEELVSDTEKEDQTESQISAVWENKNRESGEVDSEIKSTLPYQEGVEYCDGDFFSSPEPSPEPIPEKETEEEEGEQAMGSCFMKTKYREEGTSPSNTGSEDDMASSKAPWTKVEKPKKKLKQSKLPFKPSGSPDLKNAGKGDEGRKYYVKGAKNQPKASSSTAAGNGRTRQDMKAKRFKMTKSYSDRDTENYRNGYPHNEDDPRKNANLKFYKNEIESTPDGAFIDEIHEDWWGNYRLLERHHGYIQWLFPIREDGMNWHAQRLMKHEAEAIKKDRKAKQRVLMSYKLMLDFYGMELKDETTGELQRSHNYEEQFNNLNWSSHNNLRITRILKSLGELGYEYLKKGFLEFVIKEAALYGTLDRTLSSCRDYWIGTIKDDETRQMLHEELDKYDD